MSTSVVDFDEWETVDTHLRRVAAERARLDAEEAVLLVAGLRLRLHERVGFGSYREYLERVCGYAPREAAERMRVARTLAETPALAAALAAGDLCWSSVRELARVADAETEAVWLAEATGKTVRQIEALVSGRRRGELPGAPRDEAARQHTLRIELSGEAYALWREAVMLIRRELGGEIAEDDAVLEIARRVLGGPNDDGRASYQVMARLCPACGDGHIVGRGEAIAVAPQVAEMIACDAQHIPATGDGRASQDIPPATRRFVKHRDGARCTVDGCRAATFLDAHHLTPRADGGPSDDPEQITLLCVGHHRALHLGKLVIRGKPSTGLSFEHADGSPYGAKRVHPPTADLFAQTYGALCNLGFRQTDARRAVDQLRHHATLPRTVDALIRAALALLTPPKHS
jgi:hypothetical protein